jgi:phenylalanyl-tRNA synthetase beta chain
VVAGAVPEWRRTIGFETAEVKRLGGLELPRGDIIRILTKLGFQVSGGDILTVVPPSWRSDVHGGADLVEEIVRIHGLDKVPSVPMRRPYAVAQPVLTPAQRRIAACAPRSGRARLRRDGALFLHSARPCGFVRRRRRSARAGESHLGRSRRDAAEPAAVAARSGAAQPGARLRLRDVLRSRRAIRLRHARGAGQCRGRDSRRRAAAPLDQGCARSDLSHAKADALARLEAAWGGPVTAPVQAGAHPWYHPGRSGTIALGPKVLATFGELHPRIIAAFDLKGPVCGFEIFLDAIPEPKARPTKARAKLEPSDLMAVERDFAFILDAGIAAESVVKAARGVDRQLIERVELFDLYEGKGVPEGKKSLAIAVRLQPKERTLTDAEIEAVGQKIVSAVTKATGGILRS